MAFYGDDPSGSLRIALVRDGAIVPLTPPQMHVTDFAWMPDGRALLVSYAPSFLGPEKLGVLSVAGGLLRIVNVDRPFAADQNGMTVRADGRVAIVSMSRPGPGNDVHNLADLVEVDLRSGSTRNLTRSPASDDRWPAYAARDRLVFTGGVLTEDATNSGWVSEIDLRTGAVRRLTPTEQVVDGSTAAPGSPWIVYVTDRLDPRGRALWMVPIVGGRPTQLLHEGDLRWPALSSDGRTLLVTVLSGRVGVAGGFRAIALPGN